jgi:hypothetical protein
VPAEFPQFYTGLFRKFPLAQRLQNAALIGLTCIRTHPLAVVMFQLGILAQPMGNPGHKQDFFQKTKMVTRRTSLFRD